MTEGQEIERRFVVVQHDPEFVSRLPPGMMLQQGIIRGDENHALRVRIVTDRTNERALLTYKEGRCVTRVEREVGITFPAARLLLATALHGLGKTRYNLDDGGELDFFDGIYSGLIIIEYELERANQQVLKPPWIKEWVEVTDRLTSAALSQSAGIFRDFKATPDTITRLVLDHFR